MRTQLAGAGGFEPPNAGTKNRRNGFGSVYPSPRSAEIRGCQQRSGCAAGSKKNPDKNPDKLKRQRARALPSASQNAERADHFDDARGTIVRLVRNRGISNLEAKTSGCKLSEISAHSTRVGVNRTILRMTRILKLSSICRVG